MPKNINSATQGKNSSSGPVDVMVPRLLPNRKQLITIENYVYIRARLTQVGSTCFGGVNSPTIALIVLAHKTKVPLCQVSAPLPAGRRGRESPSRIDLGYRLPQRPGRTGVRVYSSAITANES